MDADTANDATAFVTNQCAQIMRANDARP